MSTTFSNNTFGTAMTGKDTVGAHARRHAARRAAAAARQPQWSRIGAGQFLPQLFRRGLGGSGSAHKGALITKMLVSGAIALGIWVGVAAPASANPNAVGANPNQFGALSCSCQETPSPGGLALTEEIKQGIRAGLSASLGKPQPYRGEE
jgi:hypothetical protein